QPNQVGMVELALGRRRQPVAIDVELDALECLRRCAIVDAFEPRHHAPGRCTRALDLEGPRAAPIEQRPVGADVRRCCRIGVDHHLAADAMCTGDAAEEDARLCGLGHGAYAAGLASPPPAAAPPSAFLAASAWAASRSRRFFTDIRQVPFWSERQSAIGRLVIAYCLLPNSHFFFPGSPRNAGMPLPGNPGKPGNLGIGLPAPPAGSPLGSWSLSSLGRLS